MPDLPRRHRHRVQIFGGNGFTVEFDIQLYFRRAKALQLDQWNDRYLGELIAADVLAVGLSALKRRLAMRQASTPPTSRAAFRPIRSPYFFLATTP